MKLLLVVLALFAVVLAGNGILGLLDPPYTDEELAASFVDTWEPHAIVTTLLLAILSVAALAVCIVLAVGGADLRRYSLVTLLVVVSAIASQLASHVALSNRVTRLTGQTFGGFYGLF